MSKIHQKYLDHMEALLSEIREDTEKADKGVKAAQVRYRTNAMALVKTCQAARSESLDMSKNG